MVFNIEPVSDVLALAIDRDRLACERVQDHLDAGATHVCIQPLDVANPTCPSLKTLEALAPSLLEG